MVLSLWVLIFRRPLLWVMEICVNSKRVCSLKNVKTYITGDIIQLERKGYYICDKPLESPSANTSIHLIFIPDGKVSNMASKAAEAPKEVFYETQTIDSIRRSPKKSLKRKRLLQTRKRPQSKCTPSSPFTTILPNSNTPKFHPCTL